MSRQDVHYYVTLTAAFAAFLTALIAYLFHSDDVTKGLTAAAFGALLTVLNPSGAKGGTS